MPFSQETLDFLFENHFRDSRDWFQEHKEEYRRLVFDPLAELVQTLTPTMLKIDRQFVTEPRVDKTICRIRRDTRFTHDPSLYRDAMWIIFKRERMHSTEFPGLYFEVNGEGFSYGGGFYHASTAYMETLRGLILRGDPTFAKAQKAFASQSVFRMEGDCYKRPHYPDQPPELAQWLERRNLSFNADSNDLDLLFSSQLPQVLEKGFRKMAPIYDFLLQAALLQPREDVIQAGARREEWND